MTGGGWLRRTTTVAGFAAILVFSGSGEAFAGFWDGLFGGGRGSAPAEKAVRTKGPQAADIDASCGKCHSACEAGRQHEGIAPVNTASALPLGADGRTTCLTCHTPHGKGPVKGASLRLSNLRRELCLSCHTEQQGCPSAAETVQVISPLEGAVVNEARMPLIGRADGLRSATLTVRVNGAEFHLHVKGQEFYTRLTLQEGVNRIELAHEGHVLWRGEVFHGERSAGSYERTSIGHLTESQEQCRDCHKNGGSGAEVAGATPELCFGCHERNDRKRYVHGPLAVGACLACHDPHAGYGSAHLRREQTLLCGNCHIPRESDATAACHAAGRGCVECHDPHQSDVKYLLKGPQYTMRAVAPRQP